MALAIGIADCHSETRGEQLGAGRGADNHTAGTVSAFIAEASDRFDVQGQWIRAVIATESAGIPRAVSSKGAMGLMQIMPETWTDLRLRYGLGTDPYDAHDNIIAGTGYLRDLYDRYGTPGFLAAYNAGPKRWEEHLAMRQTAAVGYDNLSCKARFNSGSRRNGRRFSAPVDRPFVD